METFIEKSENGAENGEEPSFSPIKTSPAKPFDLSTSLDRSESMNSDVFEEAIEPPVQDSGNNGESVEEIVEERGNGDLVDFESSDSDLEELKTPVGDSEEIEGFNGGLEEKPEEVEGFNRDLEGKSEEIEGFNGHLEEKSEKNEGFNGDFEEKLEEIEGFNGDLEQLETPIGNSKEKSEEIEGFNGDLEQLETPIEDSKEKSEEVEGLNGDLEEVFKKIETSVRNQEDKDELEIPEEIESYDDTNNVLQKEQESETINGETEAGINGEQSVHSDKELNNEEILPDEKIMQEFTDALPDLVIKQEAESSNKREEGINGEEIQTGDLQSDEEILLEKIIRESKETEPVIIEEDLSEDKIEESREIEPVKAESSEIKNRDLQYFIPHEDKIEESGEIDAVKAESSNGDFQFFTQKQRSPEEIEKSRYIDEIISESESENGDLIINEELKDPIITTEESTETESENLQSNSEIPKQEITQEPQELNLETIQHSSINNNNIIISSSSSSSSEEAPIVEEIYDSSSSSDNDEKEIIQEPKETSSNPPSIFSINPQTTQIPKSNSDSNTTNPVPPPVTPPAGLGSSASLPHHPSSTMTRPTYNRGPVSGPVSVPVPVSGAVSVGQRGEEGRETEVEEQDEVREKLMNIRVKFLRLVHRLGQTPHNTVVAQVLYRLGLAEQLRRNSTRPVVVSFDRASILAEQLELSGSDPLDFSCTIMLLGKAGVGKSSTINSLFNSNRVPIHTFGPGTKSVNLTSGNIHGINVKVIDTPGLSSSLSDTHENAKILNSVKKFVKKSPPDIVLYFDRLDVQSRDYGDVALLQSITNVFGPSIWFNAIIVLTHAGSAPPEGQNGTALSYDMFVTQRTHVVQQNIRQAAGDVRLMNPVSLVENHLMCRMNRAGKRVLPNGTVWEPQLLLLSFASKILGEANALLKLEDNNGNNGFNNRGNKRNPPLPYFLSGLLQSRGVVKLPEEFEGDLDEDLEEDFEEDFEEEDYDDLPPFKRLSKDQLERLDKVQKKAYLDEIEYREKLFYRKQLKEERKRRKLIKKMKQQQEAMNVNNDINNEENVDEGPGTVPVPMPDMVLPASFDSDAPAHRYRFLDSNSQWLVRPVLDLHGWDHDVGYEGLNLERLFVLKNKIPISVSGQLAKDKKESSLQMDVSSSIKHGERKTSSFGLDLQAVGKDMSYTLRGETRFRNFTRNATSAGGSVIFLGDSISAGVKLEDKLVVNKQVKLSVTGGAMTSRGDVACGARLEASFKDKDYPIGRFLSSLAISGVEWHGDRQLALSCQSQVPIGRGANLVLNGNVNNKGSGQVGIRVSSSDQVGFVVVALVPFFGYFKRLVFGSGFE